MLHFIYKTDNMILILKFNGAVLFYFLYDLGDSLVLHCEQQDSYPSNDGEVA